jgi:hypothetical protein
MGKPANQLFNLLYVHCCRRGVALASRSTLRGALAYPYRPRAVTTVSTIIYGPCRSRPACRTLVAKVKDGVLLPAWYAQPNHEGTAGPLASVLAESRLMSVVQECRMKRTRLAHGLAFSIPLMIVGLLPFGLLSPGAAPKSLYVHAYSPEDIRAEFAREQKQKEYDRVEHIARKLFRSYGCRGDLAPATARSAVDLGLNIRILTALIFVESSCRTNAVSSKDAVGPTQVNWRVWRQYTRQQLLDPETNVRAGSKILAGYVRLYGIREGLHAYNGFGDPTSAYADKVLLVAGYRIH